jgi:hypothetical protein
LISNCDKISSNLFARTVNIEILGLKCPSEPIFVNAGLDAVPLVQEVVPVGLAAAVIKLFALAGVRVIEETHHSIKMAKESCQNLFYNVMCKKGYFC